MKKILTLLLAVSVSVAGMAQALDEKSKQIMDGLSKRTKAYSTIKAEFTATMEDKAADLKQSQKGTLNLKGKKYRLDIQGQTVISDGVTIWTVLEDEVQLTDYEEAAEEEDAINPSSIFTLHESGFKYKFEKEATEGGKTYQYINLYPKEAGEKSYHTVKLKIDKAKGYVKTITVLGKEGANFIYDITKFTPNVAMDDKLFKFSSSEFPGRDENDLR